MLPATRQRWHSRLYPSRSWYSCSIKRPRRDARLSWPSWFVRPTYRYGRAYTRPKTVTHPSTNRARRALTLFMWRTPLTSPPTVLTYMPRYVYNSTDIMYPFISASSGSHILAGLITISSSPSKSLAFHCSRLSYQSYTQFSYLIRVEYKHFKYT